MRVKVLWDFRTQTDHHLDNKPDILVFGKKEKVCSIIDVACPLDIYIYIYIYIRVWCKRNEED